MKSFKTISIIVVIGFICYFFWQSFSGKEEQDLKGSFKELAFIRNEQNSGPVLRVYAVSLSDTLWNEMKTYGDYKPHTKYGNTKVYFFLEGKPAPREVSLDNAPFDEQFKKYCIAVYEKSAMSQSSFIQYPFR